MSHSDSRRHCDMGSVPEHHEVMLGAGERHIEQRCEAGSVRSLRLGEDYDWALQAFEGVDRAAEHGVGSALAPRYGDVAEPCPFREVTRLRAAWGRDARCRRGESPAPRPTRGPLCRRAATSSPGGDRNLDGWTSRRAWAGGRCARRAIAAATSWMPWVVRQFWVSGGAVGAPGNSPAGRRSAGCRRRRRRGCRPPG